MSSIFKNPSIKNVIMINGIVVVDRSYKKDGYILKLNNFLNSIKDIEHSLLYPMKGRVNNAIINDDPKSITPST